jgi:quercetin dioxygenase-like cupin family protein
MTDSPIRRFQGFRWDDVELMRYKQEGSAPFLDITRQILFEAPNLACELRYFEVAPGGYSTLERHVHMHAVMALRGQGQCLVGDAVYEIGPNDLVEIPPMTWHQFRATGDAPLGFLCLVNCDRDKPQLPSEADLEGLRRNQTVAAFIRV